MRAWLRSALLAVGLVALWATPAAAHAALEDTWPVDSQRLDTAPEELRLGFNEPIEIGAGSLRLLDQNGNEIEIGATRHAAGYNTEITAVVPPLDDGTYVALWRVVSADGHPVNGSWVFHIGAGEPGYMGMIDSVRALNRVVERPLLDVGYGVARVGAYLGVVAVIGVGWVGVTQRDRLTPSPQTRRLVGLFTAGALGVVVFSMVGFLLYAASATVTPIGSASGIDAALTTVQGQAWVARAFTGAGLVALGGWWWSRRGQVSWLWAGLVAVVALGSLISYAYSGHSATGSGALKLSAVLHLGGLGVWLGGVGAVLLARPVLSFERWSPHGLVAFVVLLVAGTGATFRTVNSVHALIRTNYGMVLLIKLAFVALIMWLGFRNWRQVRSSIEPTSVEFRLRAFTEVALAVGALVVASVLVATTPAAVAAVRPIKETHVLSLTGVTEGPWDPYDWWTVDQFDFIEAKLQLTPAKVGRNEMTIQTRLANRTPYGAHWLTVTAANPAAGIDPYPVRALRVGNDRFLVDKLDLGVAGRWEIEVTVWINAEDRVSTVLYADISPTA